MKEAAQNSKCIIAVVTGAYADASSASSVPGRVLNALSAKPEENAYFKREYCLNELRWARQAGVRIQPVIDVEDKTEIGTFLSQAPEDLQDLGRTLDFKCLVPVTNALWETSIDELGIAPRATAQAQLRLSKDIADIPVGSKQREDFEDDFRKELAMSIVSKRDQNDTHGRTLQQFLFQMELEKYEDALKEEGYTLMSIYTAPEDEIEDLTRILDMKRPEKRTFVTECQRLREDVQALKDRIQITSLKEGSIIVVFEIQPAAGVAYSTSDATGADTASTPRSRQLQQLGDLSTVSIVEILEQIVDDAQPQQPQAGAVAMTGLEADATAAAAAAGKTGDLMSLIMKEPLQLEWIPQHPDVHEGTPPEIERSSGFQISLTEDGAVVEEDETTAPSSALEDGGAPLLPRADEALPIRSRSNQGDDLSGSLSASLSASRSE